MNDRWDQFTRIWLKGKVNKTVQSIMQKVIIRGLKPTEEKCRDYYMGYIRFYKNEWSGEEHHINPRKNKTIMKNLKRSRNVKKNYKGRKTGGRKPHHVGNRHPQKKRKIR